MERAESEGALIAIPVGGKALAAFIVDLLGTRRSTERSFRRYSFNIDLNWLANLHHIIAQRFDSQNAGELVDFKSVFYYDIGRVHSIHSLDAFLAYHDISNDVCIAVELSWVYLIKFPNKDIPEKQQIDFIVTVDREYRVRAERVRYSFLHSIQIGTDNRSIIRSIVHYSDFSWGEDISAHIARYV